MAVTLDDFARPADLFLPQTPDSLRGVAVVAFDLDCTLVDILRVKERAAEAAAWALADEGLDFDLRAAAAEIVHFARGNGFDHEDVVDRWLRSRGFVDPKFALVARHAWERAEDDAATMPYPRARRTLIELARRGYRLALVTDADRHRALRRLRASGLLPFFEQIIAREDTPDGKRGPAPFVLVAERFGVLPEAILMVGDHPKLDVGSARAVGLRTALAEYGLQPWFHSDAPEHQPDRRVQWLDELLHLLPPRGTCERPLSPPESPSREAA